MAAISVIVPVYNVKAYLPKCIDSILAQTYKDFELILVDDGSPDCCGEICDEYAKKDNRIRVIHQENKGVSAARNAGLRSATGIYIGFVDPDDWIESDMYEKLKESIEKNNADLAFCRWTLEYPDGTSRLCDYDGLPELMDGKEFVSHLYKMPFVTGAVWKCLFRSTQITAMFDETATYAEDLLFLIQYCRKNSVIVYVENAAYHFFQRPQSATRTSVEKNMLEIPTRRKATENTVIFGKDVHNLAENSFLDRCLWYLLNNAVNKQSCYRRLVRQEFRRYLRRHLVNVLLNREIIWKLRIMLFLKYAFMV